MRTFITVVLSGLGQYLHFPFNLETDPVQDSDRTEEEWITSEHRTQGWANDFVVVVKASRHSNWLWWSPSCWRDGVHLWIYVWLLGYVRKEAQMKLQESKGECVHITASHGGFHPTASSTQMATTTPPCWRRPDLGKLEEGEVTRKERQIKFLVIKQLQSRE